MHPLPCATKERGYSTSHALEGKYTVQYNHNYTVILISERSSWNFCCDLGSLDVVAG